MPFSVTAAANRRFDGDFLLEPMSGYTPPPEEQVVLGAVQRTLARLADGEKQDAAAGLPPELLDGRRSWRKLAATAMRSVADAFASGRFDATKAAERANAADQQFAQTMPRFGTADAVAPRFAGEFQIVVAEQVTADEDLFISRIQKTILDRLAADEKTDAAAGYSAGVSAARKKLRTDTACQYRDLAKEVAAGRTQAAFAADEIPEAWGGYVVLRDQLTQTLFDVTIFQDDGPDGKKYDAGLELELIEGLPPPNDTVSPDKQELFNDINSALTVIGVVCRRMREGGDRWFDRGPEDATKKRYLRLHAEYVGKIHGVARIGLKQSYTAFAKSALLAFKNEFVAREAGRIKNSYVLALGLWPMPTTISSM